MSTVTEVPGRLCVTIHAPTLIAFDHKFHLVPDHFPDALQGFEIFLKARTTEPDLKRFEPPLHGVQSRIGHSVGMEMDTAGTIHRHGVRKASKHFPAGDVSDLAHEIVQGDGKRPGTGGIEADIFHDPVMPGQIQRILSDEKLLIVGKTLHGVARPDAHPAVGIENPDDGGGKFPARLEFHAAGNGGFKGNILDIQQG